MTVRRCMTNIKALENVPSRSHSSSLSVGIFSGVEYDRGQWREDATM